MTVSNMFAKNFTTIAKLDKTKERLMVNFLQICIAQSKETVIKVHKICENMSFQ